MIKPKSKEYVRTVQLLPTMNDTMISKEVKLSRERIRQIRNEHGIPSPHKNKRCDPFWTEEKVAKLVSLDVNKYSAVETAEIFKCSRNIILKKAKELGMERFKDPRRKYTEESMRALYEKHSGNFSQMAKELNIPHSGVARECYRYGLKGKGLRNGNGGYNWKSERYQYDDIVIELWGKYKGNQYQIAKNSDVPLGSVRGICIRLGLACRGRQRKYTYEIIKPLFDKHKGDYPAMDRELGAWKGCARISCKRLGIGQK